MSELTHSPFDTRESPPEKVNSPRPYNLFDPNELRRLMRECEGYLRVCHKNHGTDWEGRNFAMQALRRLQCMTLTADIGAPS